MPTPHPAPDRAPNRHHWMPAIGETIGHYIAGDYIRDSQFGPVMLATHTDAPVTVEIAVPEISGWPAERFEKFRAKVGRQIGLDHPAIVPMIEAIDIAGRPMVVMQHNEGASALRDFMHNREPVAVGLGCQWLKEIADALDYAASVIGPHRALGPDTVIVTANQRAIVREFGAAWIDWPAPSYVEYDWATTISQSRLLFMSPEEAAGTTADAPADVYALGVLAVWLLTGHFPTPTDLPVMQQLKRKIYGELTPVADLDPDLPAELAEFLAEMLALDPAARPALELASRTFWIHAESPGR